MNIFVGLIINIISLMVVSYLVPGFYFADLRALLVAAVVIGVINMFIRPVLQLIALPLSILTLGLFAFFINVSLLWLAGEIVPGFQIQSFFTAAIASIIMALIGAFFHKMERQK
jgi:putative membrane protein